MTTVSPLGVARDYTGKFKGESVKDSNGGSH